MTFASACPTCGVTLVPHCKSRTCDCYACPGCKAFGTRDGKRSVEGSKK